MAGRLDVGDGPASAKGTAQRRQQFTGLPEAPPPTPETRETNGGAQLPYFRLLLMRDSESPMKASFSPTRIFGSDAGLADRPAPTNK